MTILLIRHGETLLNASRTLQPAATPLGPRGRAQARALAQRLAGAPISAIVSSDLPRAVETAEAIAAAHGLIVVLEPELRERDFGDFRGRRYDDFDFDPTAMADAPPNGESVATFRARVARAFERIVALRAEADGDLAVVTHGLVIGAILDTHARLPSTLAPPTRLGNTGLSVLAAEAPHEVALLDCTAHLSGGADADDPLSLSGG